MSQDSIFMVNVEKIYFQMKKTPQNKFILLNFHVNFEDEKKNTTFTANAALKYSISYNNSSANISSSGD